MTARTARSASTSKTSSSSAVQVRQRTVPGGHAAPSQARADEDDLDGAAPAYLPPDYRLKVLVMGDPGTGKTTLITNLSLSKEQSSPLQRLSSFLHGSRKIATVRDQQEPPSLSSFQSDDLVDVAEWHPHGRKLKSGDSRTADGREQEADQNEEKKKHRKKKKNKQKSDAAQESEPADMIASAAGQPNTTEQGTSESGPNKPNEETAKGKRLLDEKRKKRRSKSFADLEALASEENDSDRKLQSYGISSELELKIYSLPILGDSSFTVSAFDFSRKVFLLCAHTFHDSLNALPPFGCSVWTCAPSLCTIVD